VLLTILMILNVPVYLFLAWVVFDTKEAAADTIWDTLIALLKIIFVPWYVRVLLNMDTTGAIGCLPILAYVLACAFLTYGEYWLLTKFVFTT